MIKANNTLLSDLELICAEIPAGILNREGYQRLVAVASALPAELSNFWGLECRLNTEAPLADILFEIKNNSTGQQLLAGLAPSCLDPLCAEHDVWHDMRSFTRLWSQRQCILNRYILNMWLEYDTERLAPDEMAADLIRNPSVFLGFRSRELPTGDLTNILRYLNMLLHIPDKTLKYLESFVRGIPSPGQLFQLGSMLGRPGRGIRACVNQLKADIIPGWLSEMGWPGDIKALSELLRSLTQPLRGFAIDLDLTDGGLSEKIGIECYMDWDDMGAGQWAAFLECVQKYIQCSPGKVKDLLHYPGSVPLPPEQRKGSGNTLFLYLFKMIHHIKLDIREGRVTGAKAYLAIYRPGIRIDDNWFVQ